MRNCIFCGEAAGSREHAIPEWVLKALPPNAGTLEGTRGTDEPILIHGRPRKPASLIVKHVCDSCNTGWMSQLETEAKPLMSPLMRDLAVPFSPGDQATISTWAVKTAMVFEFIRPSTQDVFSSDAERKALWTTRLIPPRTMVWLGRYGGRTPLSVEGYDLSTGLDVEHPVTGWTVTFSFGCLVVQILSARSEIELRLDVEPQPGPWANSTVQIWPTQRRVAWPPAISFYDDREPTFQSFVRRFSFGPHVDQLSHVGPMSSKAGPQKTKVRTLRSPDDIKKRVTGDIRELNRRLLPLAQKLVSASRKRKWANELPGMILHAFYRKAVNTFTSIETLKASRLIEESWIQLRVLLEAYINFFYFARNNPVEMAERYVDAIVIDKLKYLHSVSYFDGKAPWASSVDADEWRARETAIKTKYSLEEYAAIKKNGFTGKSVETRAKTVGLTRMYDTCYRLASRNAHLFDPADTPLYRLFVPKEELGGLLKSRREELEVYQNMLLGRMSLAFAEFQHDPLMNLKLILIGMGYEKYRDSKPHLDRIYDEDFDPDPEGTMRVWRE